MMFKKQIIFCALVQCLPHLNVYSHVMKLSVYLYLYELKLMEKCLPGPQLWIYGLEMSFIYGQCFTEM